ncbi:MAG: hypothetical protein MMC33_004403 [Icmadophila ericetorum]|nr:hypothetical protein [Icmadophila ericetorum]
MRATVPSYQRLSIWRLLSISLLFGIGAEVVSGEKPLESDERAVAYTLGQAVQVSCLNRMVDTGEHISDSQGQLQYIPFPVCNETNRPLELSFGVEKEINCTLASLSDPLFHLLEFYIHSDAPLTCRVPTVPLPETNNPLLLQQNQQQYTPIQFALIGTLQLSHLHMTPSLNLILHTAPLGDSTPPKSKPKAKDTTDGEIIAGTAYSIPPLDPEISNKRLIIGDPLPLHFNVRWYTTRSLPPSTSTPSGLGGHVHFSTGLYCLLSMGAGVALSWAYWRGWELPRRLKGYKGDRVGGGENGYNGFGNGPKSYAWPGGGSGNGWVTPVGKRD